MGVATKCEMHAGRYAGSKVPCNPQAAVHDVNERLRCMTMAFLPWPEHIELCYCHGGMCMSYSQVSLKETSSEMTRVIKQR